MNALVMGYLTTGLHWTFAALNLAAALGTPVVELEGAR